MSEELRKESMRLEDAGLLEEWSEVGDHIMNLHAELDRLHQQLAERGEPVADIPDYDAGMLNDWGGGNTDWWLDYLRAEIGRCNDYWRSCTEDIAPPAQSAVPEDKDER